MRGLRCKCSSFSSTLGSAPAPSCAPSSVTWCVHFLSSRCSIISPRWLRSACFLLFALIACASLPQGEMTNYKNQIQEALRQAHVQMQMQQLQLQSQALQLQLHAQANSVQQRMLVLQHLDKQIASNHASRIQLPVMRIDVPGWIRSYDGLASALQTAPPVSLTEADAMVSHDPTSHAV